MFKSRMMAAILAAIICLSVAGCGADSLVYMNYGTGIDQFGRYNTELYGANGIYDPSGPDPGVFYVSKEEDPEYGGYFYRYHSSEVTSIPSTDYYKDGFISRLAFYCDRSTDLYHWEPAGALAGRYSLGIDKYDWCGVDFWAPEVIRNPADGKYYMYFNARVKSGLQLSGVDNTGTYAHHLGVAVSDTPCGPFDVIGNVDEETGILAPTINFMKGLNLEHGFPLIDAHAFFDNEGQLYVYGSNGNRIIGVQMKTMSEPDYSTVRVLTEAQAYTVDSEPGKVRGEVHGESYFTAGNRCDEAPFVIEHNGKYYLTFSVYGYGNQGYAVHQAVADHPLGPFTKLSQEQGNPVLDGSLFSDVVGTGHHSLVTVGDELWIAYHRHSGVVDGLGWDRPTAVDRVAWVVNGDGLEVMSANGPGKILTWLPEEISGYENLAPTASISVNNGTGIQYLTDEALNLYTVAQNYKLSVDSGDVTITLRWDKPVSVSSVMVYNSNIPETAFSQISSIRFKLAEKPDWASKDYDWAVIENVPLPSQAWDEISETYLECAPAVAEFDPITVTEIQITIKQADHLMEYNASGTTNTVLDIPEIVVLGGDVTNE